MAIRCTDDTSQLLARVAEGDSSAANQLLLRHRERLVAMVRLRMDCRLKARFDPSDVVQDSLVEAHDKLHKYAQFQPIPFYLWLRGIAWQRLVQLQRKHSHAKCRSVGREQRVQFISDQSEAQLAESLVRSATRASGHVIRNEVRNRVRTAIQKLPDISREIIVLRHLEELSFKEIMEVLGLGEAAIYSRYRRSIESLTKSLTDHSD